MSGKVPRAIVSAGVALFAGAVPLLAQDQRPAGAATAPSPLHAAPSPGK